MLLTVYDKNGTRKAVLSPDDSSTQVKAIQGDNVLTLSFALYGYVALEVGDYTDFHGERYWLQERYLPSEHNTQEWKYDVRFYGLESLIRRFLVLNTVDGVPEAAFTLTAPAREHVALVVRSINEGFGTTVWKVGEVADTDNLVLDYEGKYCHEALRDIAKAAGVEYWLDGTTVNLTRCEYGEEVTLGYGRGLTSLDRDSADGVRLYTRLFPVGSSRNIDPARYGHSRLQLPGGAKYVDVNTDRFGIFHHYERAAFSGIYPRYTGTVSSVRSEERKNEDGDSFTVWYFKDSSLPFDPNNYELPDEVKRVSFQSGELSGLGTGDDHYFEVNFDSATREFEIITVWPYGDDTQLPGGRLVPAAGDRYIPWNIRMPDEYYPLAEREYLEAVHQYNREHAVDVSVYKGPTDHVYVEEHGLELYPGRRVRLESDEYFPGDGYRSSRITKVTRKVTLPSQMDIEIGDALSSGVMEQVGDSIEDMKNYVRQSSGSGYDVVRSWEDTPASDYNVASYRMTLKQIARLALSRLKPDEAKGLIKFLSGLEAGEYKEGLSGAKIDAAGNAVFGELLTRLKATLAELQVNGDSEFRGRLSSEDFISGFIGGRGWSIFKREVLNALGVPETKYTGEFDDIVVRGALRVFTLVISQLLGENDNRIFTGMMEVDHYDPETGKVYLNTRDGKFYNPFRQDDYIMVQQYNGMPSEENGHYITKHYELIVTGAGCGEQSDGENRLDWVTFKNFVSADGREAADAITKGDTLTRVDNATDADRKGLIQIITVGTATPYMDIVYGMKTDPDNSLKGRLGNLKGIHHPLFGWLDGFGELLTNLYAVGDFRLRRTGESLDAKIEMLKALFATRYGNLRYELTEDDNYLRNATFDETMDGWTVRDDGKVITSNGEALLMNGNTYIADGRIAGIEQLDGRNVLHLKKSSIRQANALIRKPGTHKEYVPPTANDMTDRWVEVKDTLYMSLRFLAKSDGTLTVGMSGAASEPGSLPVPATVAVTASTEWRDLQWQGTWDGKGDFVLQYTGDMYVSVLSVTDKPLDDFRKEVSTQIIQTAGNIRLLGTNINNLKGTVTQLGIELDAAEEQIRIYADRYDRLNGTVTNLGVRLDAAEGSITNYATRISNNETAISVLSVKTDSVSSAVTGVQGDLATAKARIEAVAAIAGSAGDAKVYNQSSNPWNSWPGGQEHKYVGATWHNTSDGHTYRYIGYDNSNTWEDITDQRDAASYILQNKDKISTVVGSFDSSGRLTNTSGLVTTAYASQIYATKTTVDTLTGRVSTAESSIDVHSTQIAMRVEKDGVISAINQSAESVIISASKINFNGMVTMNNSFRVEVNGTTHIGGFVVSGSGLTNRNDDGAFTNDAYIIFRNDPHGCFAGIGGNVLPASSGARGVARFENHDESDWWGLGHNYALIVSARGASDNTAIQLNGGCVSGLSYKAVNVTSSVTLDKGAVSVACVNTGTVTVRLPEMDIYDDGHVIKIKRLNGGTKDDLVKVYAGYGYHNIWNDTLKKYVRTRKQTYIRANATDSFASDPRILSSVGDAIELVYHRDVNNGTQYGCWVEYKHPRDW